MREIKFRQPIWFKGKFSRFHYWAFVGEGVFHGPLDSKDSQQESQQFTGLRDSKGVDIYEGDIVETCEGRDVVEYGEDIDVQQTSRAAFLLRALPPLCGLTTLGDYFLPKQLEVIGNIHENPELIKEADDAEA